MTIKKRGQNEGSIRQRKDGSYEGRITIGRDPITGKQLQKSVYGKKKTDVAKRMREIQAEVDKGTYIEPSSLTVEAWLNKWLEGFKKPFVRENTYKGYESLVRNHIIPYVGKRKLKEIRPSDIQAIYASMLEKGRVERPKKEKQYKNPPGKRPGPKPKSKEQISAGLSNKTVIAIHRVLVAAFDQAVKENLIVKNPIKDCIPPNREKKEMKTLRSAELPGFLAVAKESRNFAAYFTSIATGLRRGEVLGLQWQNVDLDVNVIRVRHQLLRTAKGLSLEPLKTRHSIRNIAIPDELTEILFKQKEMVDQEKDFAGTAYEDHDLVFPNALGQPLDPDAFSKQVKRILNRVTGGMSLHDLRHTYATLALERGAPPGAVSESLGHFSTGFTMDTYAHVTETMRLETANTMSLVLKDALKQTPDEGEEPNGKRD